MSDPKITEEWLRYAHNDLKLLCRMCQDLIPLNILLFKLSGKLKSPKKTAVNVDIFNRFLYTV